MVHWSLLSCCDFSLYMLSSSILEIPFAKMLRTCKSESFKMSDLGVHTKFCLTFKIKAIVLGLISRFEGRSKLVKDECEIVVLWSLTIHGSWRRTTSAVFVAEFKHECMTFIDLTQLCWITLMWFDWVSVKFITTSWPVNLLLTK